MRQADALDLPFDDASFDIVVCQFGAMFFPDKVRAYAEARRVLKPGGHFCLQCLGRIADNEFADVVTQALAELFGPERRTSWPATPHGYHDAAGSRRTEGRRASRGHGRNGGQAAGRFHPRDAAVDYLPGHADPQRVDARLFPGRPEEATQGLSPSALARRFGNGAIAGADAGARVRATAIDRAPVPLAPASAGCYTRRCRMHARRRGRALASRSAAPKEQPPRKLSGKRTAGGRALWKAAAGQ